jgi:hypothetical protein
MLETKDGVQRSNERDDRVDQNKERQAILNWLTPINHAAQQHDVISRR